MSKQKNTMKIKQKLNLPLKAFYTLASMFVGFIASAFLGYGLTWSICIGVLVGSSIVYILNNMSGNSLRNLHLSILLLVILFFVYGLCGRIPSSSERVTFEEPVRYQMIEPVPKDFIRYIFESFFSDKVIVRLSNGHPFWLPKADVKKLWPESVWSMKNKGYTMIAKISAQPLIFGGYGDAKLLEHKKIASKPLITK